MRNEIILEIIDGGPRRLRQPRPRPRTSHPIDTAALDDAIAGLRASLRALGDWAGEAPSIMTGIVEPLEELSGDYPTTLVG